MNGAESSAETSRGDGGGFLGTPWYLVLAAGQTGDSAKAAVALEELCRIYWYPLYAYVRRRGYNEQDAQDLTQSFFCVFLKRNPFGRLDKRLGTFRSYLLTSLNHFLVNEHEKQQAQKRGSGQPAMPLDVREAERRYQLEPADPSTPQKLFERRWATTLIRNALARLEREFAAQNKAAIFQQLRPYIEDSIESLSYAEVAQQLGMSHEAVKKSVQRLRQRYREAVRQEIAATVSSPAEIDEELRSVFAALSD